MDRSSRDENRRTDHLESIRRCRESGDLATAERLALQHLVKSPDDPAALFELALLLKLGKKDEDALACLERANAGKDESLDALRLGVNLSKRLGKTQQAIAWMSRMAYRPSAPIDDWVHLAILLRNSRQAARAIEAIADAMRSYPDDIHLLVERGMALRELDRYAEAEADIGRAYASTTDNGPAALAWAILLSETGRPEEGLGVATAFAARHPENRQARICQASLLKAAGRLDEAAACCREVALRFPGAAEPWINLTTIYLRLGDLDASIASGIHAIGLAPQSAPAHVNLALTLLVSGRLGEAWPHYQWRYQYLLRIDYPIPPCPSDPLIRLPGDILPLDFTGRRVALIEDQGLGDELSFLRFGPLLRERGAHVTYVPDPRLASLVGRSNAVDRVTNPDENAPEETEIYLAPGDLPLMLDVSTTDGIPPPLALAADPEIATQLNERLGHLAASGRPLVGVTWRGGIHSVRGDRLFKTVSPAALALILRDLPVEVVVLQRAPLPGEVDEFSTQLERQAHDFSDLNANLESMLALLDRLDDYVSVSNTNIHLRAGLAKPARILVPFPPDYRWMAEGRESPWFPGFPIYRQDLGGQWDEALGELQHDLWLRFAGRPPPQDLVPREWPKGMRNMAPTAVASRCVRIGTPSAMVGKPEALSFVTVDSFATGSDGLPVATLASTRYRVILPGTPLARRGYDVRVFPRPDAGWSGSATDDIPQGPVVFSKSFTADNVGLASTLKQRGHPIVIDVCDNHFAHPQFGPHLQALCGLADRIVAATEAMAEAIHDATGRESQVIGDPLEGPRGEPTFAPCFPALKLLWFGHPSNLDSLREAGGQLAAAAARYPLHLTILTQLDCRTEQLGAEISELAPGRIACGVLPWTTDATWRELAACDLVILPSMADDRRSVKSPNRLLEAIWAGRLAIAHPVPSYQAFAPHCWIGGDLASGIHWAVEHQADALQRIRGGQDVIAFSHSAWNLARDWEYAIRSETKEQTIRLHLGCGDRILPGYINVDENSNIRRAKPDVVGSLRRLAMFPPDFADEILCVHAIGRFPRWEVEDVLREWLRVLKPGGRLVIECGNLEVACGKLADAPESGTWPDQRGQHTMWVLYGDPSWQDAAMVHRWGYTPGSLEDLLRAVGLVNVRQEPAQFKLKEPRDMRLVGEKASESLSESAR